MEWLGTVRFGEARESLTWLGMRWEGWPRQFSDGRMYGVVRAGKDRAVPKFHLEGLGRGRQALDRSGAVRRGKGYSCKHFR